MHSVLPYVLVDVYGQSMALRINRHNSQMMLSVHPITSKTHSIYSFHYQIFSGKNTLAQVSIAYIPEILEMKCRSYLIAHFEEMKKSLAPTTLVLGFNTVLRKLLCGKEAVHLKLDDELKPFSAAFYAEFWGEVV